MRKKKGFTLVEITLVIVLIAILIAITTPLVSSVVTRNDLSAAHESLYNVLLRAQQLSKTQYKDSQWRVCIDNTAKTYTITAGTCTSTQYPEIITINSGITVSSEETLDIPFKLINGELDSTNDSIKIDLNGGGVNKSIIVNKSGVIDKDINKDSAPIITTPSIVTNGLVLHLDAGDVNSYPGFSNGQNWFDLSGNNNHGVIPLAPATPTYSISNGVGFDFDGVNDYVDIVSEQNIANSSEITADLFVRMNGITTTSTNNWGGQYLVFRKNSRIGQFEGFQIRFNQNDNKFYIESTPSSGTPQLKISSSTLVNYGTIYHVVGTFKSNDSMKIYVNGNIENITNMEHSLDIPSNTTLKLGRSLSPFEGPAKATMYNVKIYNRVLTPEEIQQNFNAIKGRFGL